MYGADRLMVDVWVAWMCMLLLSTGVLEGVCVMWISWSRIQTGSTCGGVCGRGGCVCMHTLGGISVCKMGLMTLRMWCATVG